PFEERHGDAAELDHDDHDHGNGGHDHGHDGHDGHDHGDGAYDLHFWTDPDRLAALAPAIRDHLIALAPDAEDDLRATTRSLIADLDALTSRYEEGLADCASRDVLVTHASFGYLADRFDLNQIPITGLIPSEDPSARQIADAVEMIEDRDITTVFTEPLISARIAEAVAEEAGIDIAVIDPLEGIADTATGDDYLEIMDANLIAL